MPDQSAREWHFPYRGGRGQHQVAGTTARLSEPQSVRSSLHMSPGSGSPIRLRVHQARAVTTFDDMNLGRTIPALPARDVTQAVAFYADKLGFQVLHHDAGFAVLRRDDAVLHLWQSDDESWTTRFESAASPVNSGAESFLAGTASCRIEVSDVDALFTEMQAAGVLHPISRHGVDATDYGTREFSVLDGDGNLIGFHVWVG